MNYRLLTLLTHTFHNASMGFIERVCVQVCLDFSLDHQNLECKHLIFIRQGSVSDLHRIELRT